MKDEWFNIFHGVPHLNTLFSGSITAAINLGWKEWHVLIPMSCFQQLRAGLVLGHYD